MFCAIAPFVEAGSHIDMIDEDYGGWRWYFDGRWLYKFSGFTVYPCCPPLLAAPPDDRVHSSLRPTPLAAARDAEEAFWQVASRVLRQAPPLADQVFRRQCMAAVSRWAEAARAERAACERSNPSEAG